ncbi:MAG: methyltransferase family protein [Anaerolineales bacterium]
MTEGADSPGVPLPPPLIPLFFFVLGAAVGSIPPSGVIPAPNLPWLGWALVAPGILLIGTAFRAMVRAGTSVDPAEPARALVTDGPFRYLRNPIYAGFTLLHFGVALGLRLPGPLILTPFVPITLQIVVIAREEAYLERRFGEDYRRYKMRVRRWGIL